mgnify:CR=1 FL=1
MQFIGELVKGQSLWSVLAIFCGLVLVGTTFISHTVGAMVILPIVQAVGDQMPGNHSKLLVMGAALMCSGRRGYRGEAGRGGGRDRRGKRRIREKDSVGLREREAERGRGWVRGGGGGEETGMTSCC